MKLNLHKRDKYVAAHRAVNRYKSAACENPMYGPNVASVCLSVERRTRSEFISSFRATYVRAIVSVDVCVCALCRRAKQETSCCPYNKFILIRFDGFSSLFAFIIIIAINCLLFISFLCKVVFSWRFLFSRS